MNCQTFLIAILGVALSGCAEPPLLRPSGGDGGGTVAPGADGAIMPGGADASTGMPGGADGGAVHPTDGAADGAAHHDGGAGTPSDGPDGNGGSDGGFDPRNWRPTGKGLWIWYFSYTGLTAAQAADKAKQLGVRYVLIKTGQDASYWSTRYTAANVAEFTSRGILVFGWPYVTPNDIPGTITAIAQAAMVPGTSGLVLDVEVEFEGNFASQAKQLCEGIRAKVPHVWLGYTSFGWVGYHNTLPFKTFDQYCGDAFFPQVYWSDRGVSWSAGYDEALQMVAQAGLKAPVWMIESNDNTPSGGTPSTADLNSFFDKAGIFTSLWELPEASLTAKLTQLTDLHWKN